MNEGYEPDIEVSVTDEEIETEYAGYRAESVSRALCEHMHLPCDRKKADCLSGICYARRRIGVRRKAYVFYREERSRKDNTYEAVGRGILKAEQVILTGISRSSDVKTAYGMHMAPWMGKEKFGSQSSAPIQAVCFIERGRRK